MLRALTAAALLLGAAGAVGAGEEEVEPTSPLPRVEILRGLALELKAMKAKDEGTTVGLRYDYSRSFLGLWESEDPSRLLDLGLEAEGNIAFDRDTNPEDFLDSALLLRLSSQAVFGEFGPVPADGLPAEVPTVLHYELGLTGGLESNQAFSAKQWTAGARLGLTLAGGADLGRLNLLDYPFALVRLLSGRDGRFAPSGAALPAILVGFDRVDPRDDDVRVELGRDDSSFWRLSGEISFRTRIGSFNDLTWFANLSYRQYCELSPRPAVRRAHLANLRYLAASITTDLGVFFSFSRGKLPFDAKNDTVWELGCRFEF